MIAVGCFNGLGDLPHGRLEHHFIELRHHLPRAERPQIAAILARAGIVGFDFGLILELRPRHDLGPHFLGLGERFFVRQILVSLADRHLRSLHADQDVPRLDLVPVLLMRVVVGPQGGLVGIAGGQLLIHRVRQDLVHCSAAFAFTAADWSSLRARASCAITLSSASCSARLRRASGVVSCACCCAGRLEIISWNSDRVIFSEPTVNTTGSAARTRSACCPHSDRAGAEQKGKGFHKLKHTEGNLESMSTPFGGSFLLASPPDIFTPEDFTAEHRAIARATDDFWTREVEPNLEAIQHQDFDVLKRTLRKSAELGLVGVLLPEQYGGMELDLVSSMIVAEGIGRDGSYAVCHGAQAGIGVLPISMFGTEQQKQKYLPRLASAEWIAAYALTEAQAGSDALAARTRADLSPDGTHYVLSGQKMWISNGCYRGSVHRVRQGRRREIYGISGGTHLARGFARRGREEDGIEGQLHHGRLFR